MSGIRCPWLLAGVCVCVVFFFLLDLVLLGFSFLVSCSHFFLGQAVILEHTQLTPAILNNKDKTATK